MSHQSVNRDVFDAKLAAVVDPAARLVMMMKSPYRKHRKKAMEMGDMIAKMEKMVEEAKQDVQTETCEGTVGQSSSTGD